MRLRLRIPTLLAVGIANVIAEGTTSSFTLQPLR